MSPALPVGPVAICAGLLLLAFAPAPAAAQGVGVVAGRVMVRPDSGAAAPARGATVSVVGSALGAVTGADGRYAIGRVPAGAATVRVRLLGYRVEERAVRVRGGDTVRLDVTLRAEARRLAAVTTVARPADVEAFETRPNVGTVNLDAPAMAGVPSVGEPDVVRVVQLLPGVVARNDFNTGLNVRGGESDQNLVLLDGHPIYNPFHVGGLFSTFMDATVGGIELLSAAFPARYGGRLSSVLDVRSAEDARPGVHTSADLSALGATARFSGGLGAGRGSWSVAARRTYADAAAAVFTDNTFPYHFRDLHAHATYVLPGQVRLALTAYSGKDVLDLDLARYQGDSVAPRAGDGSWAYDWGNRVVGASLARDLGGRTTVEQRISTSSFSTRLDLGDGANVQRNTIRDLRLSGTVARRGAAHDASLGYEVAGHRIRFAGGSPETGTTDFDIRQRPVTAALWAEDLWRLSTRWIVQGGLRGEALSGRDWAGLSPRATVKYFVTPDLALTAGAGRVTQWLHSLAGDGPYRFFDIWLASDPYTPVGAATHLVAGGERRVGGGAGSVRVEGYFKRYDRVMEVNRSDDPHRRGDELFPARGRSYGADLLARWQPGARFGGWISYSYGVSERELDGARWAPGHDRRHDIDAVATWRLAKYRLGARFGYASGSPYTPIVGEIVRRAYDPSRDRWGTGDPQLYVEPLGGVRNSARFPANHRLDLDAARELHILGATVSPYLSVANAYNAQNVFVYLYDYSTDRPTRRAISQFPILPSAGARIEF